MKRKAMSETKVNGGVKMTVNDNVHAKGFRDRGAGAHGVCNTTVCESSEKKFSGAVKFFLSKQHPTRNDSILLHDYIFYGCFVESLHLFRCCSTH